MRPGLAPVAVIEQEGAVEEIPSRLVMFQRLGPEADAWRECALPLIAQDPARVPDHTFSGPDLPWNDEVRQVFFAEDRAAQGA